MDLAGKEQNEIDFWKNSVYENPQNFTPNNIIYKLWEAKVFLDKIDKDYKNFFENANSILEIGAGQGWASCIVKSKFPNKQVITSDISLYAVESVHYWESLFSTKLDQKFACKSYSIPLPDASIDLIFTFQSFHHFGEYKKTLQEIYRVLKPNGVCLLFDEPSCPSYIYPLALKRVNAKRPQIIEDVLKYKEIVNLSKVVGYKDVVVNFDPNIINRRPLPTIYYWILGKSRLLQKLLPCTADYLLKK